MGSTAGGGGDGGGGGGAVTTCEGGGGGMGLAPGDATADEEDPLHCTRKRRKMSLVSILEDIFSFS